MFLHYFGWTPLLLPGVSPALDDCDWFKEIKTDQPSSPPRIDGFKYRGSRQIPAVVWSGFARLALGSYIQVNISRRGGALAPSIDPPPFVGTINTLFRMVLFS
jgi:hypothetical protein